MIGVIIFAVLPFCIVSLFWVVPWSCSSTFCVGKIKFDTFKGLYHANAESWVLYSDHVEYRYYEDDGFASSEKGFYFGFIDYMRYVKWHEKVENELREAKANEDLRVCLEHWQMDIDAYSERIGRE